MGNVWLYNTKHIETWHGVIPCIFRTYWEGVPDIYKSRLHYYNEPITSVMTSPEHPLNIIRSIYRPGDFIALKLDIDNSSMETAIVDAIANDEDLLRSVGEMFYEQHYDHNGKIPDNFRGRPYMCHAITLRIWQPCLEDSIAFSPWWCCKMGEQLL